MSADKSGLVSPYNALLSKLSGVNITKKPHRPSALQLFQQASYTSILQKKVDDTMKGRPTKDRGGVLMRVTTNEFKLLSDVQQTFWTKESERVGEDMKKEWEKACCKGYSLTPEDVQR